MAGQRHVSLLVRDDENGRFLGVTKRLEILVLGLMLGFSLVSR